MRLRRILHRQPVAFLLLLAAVASIGMGADGLAADQPAPMSKAASAVLATMDRTADPCSDFYRYACGGWLATTTLPGDQAIWGRGFSEIFERNRASLRVILEQAGKNPGSPEEQKIGAYYAACMDEAAIEKVGAAPVKPLFTLIDTVKDRRSLMSVAGALHTMGMPVLFDGSVDPDFKDPTLEIAHLGQGGLGLPDRDYYLKDDARSTELRPLYAAHVARMLQLAGASAETAKKQADAIVAFETGLARSSRAAADLRDPEKNYKRVDAAGLKKLAPELPWDAYFTAAGAPGLQQISVGVPEFFTALAGHVEAAGWDALRAYLRWTVLRSAAGLLDKRFYDEYFGFYGQTLQGQKEQQARWKRCVVAADSALGEALGKVYIDRHFPGDSKKIALDLIQRVEAAFSAELPRVAWMDDETRARAMAKVKTLANKIGYPDKWIDYGKLEVKARDYFGNAIRARQFAFERDIRKVGKKVDRGEWEMTPPTVNAYYNPLANEMAFPAGILQPPFFEREFPAAMNFGGIGMVMGHELTHGFDDTGRKFDPQGRLNEWWAPAVSATFEKQAACIETLYANYEVQPGLKLDGKLTLGENIADFGGLKSAFKAWKQWSAEHPAQTPAVPGLTDDQLFFVGYGQAWCTVATPEIEQVRAKVDPHSPPRFRVNGPVSNLPEFAQAFSCKEGSAMRPAKICTVW